MATHATPLVLHSTTRTVSTICAGIVTQLANNVTTNTPRTALVVGVMELTTIYILICVSQPALADSTLWLLWVNAKSVHCLCTVPLANWTSATTWYAPAANMDTTCRPMGRAPLGVILHSTPINGIIAAIPVILIVGIVMVHMKLLV